MKFEDLEVSDIRFDEMMGKITGILERANNAINIKDRIVCENALSEAEEWVSHIHDQTIREAKQREIEIIKRELKEIIETEEN